jgi:UDP-glucose 4-epimerase
MSSEVDRQVASGFAGRNVLITGGLGFIGSNLARRLLKYGAHVCLVDSLIPEYGGNLFNVDDVAGEVRINISDVRDEHSMAYLVQGNDFLFNLAGQTSHLDSMHHPLADLEINCLAQLYILEACRTANPSMMIVFASTRQFYGKPQYLPVDEEHPLHPVDVNGINKMAGEWYHTLYHEVHDLRTVSLRLTNTYGPRMRVRDARQTFLGIWIRRLLEGEAFEVWDGAQLRDYTYVEDAVDALVLAATNPRANGQVYNLGGEVALSLKETAEHLVKVNGGGEFIVREFPSERRRIDIGSFYSDYRRIADDLGWAPRVPIDEGFKLTLEYYRRNLQRYL